MIRRLIAWVRRSALEHEIDHLPATEEERAFIRSLFDSTR